MISSDKTVKQKFISDLHMGDHRIRRDKSPPVHNSPHGGKKHHIKTNINKKTTGEKQCPQ